MIVIVPLPFLNRFVPDQLSVRLFGSLWQESQVHRRFSSFLWFLGGIWTSHVCLDPAWATGIHKNTIVDSSFFDNSGLYSWKHSHTNLTIKNKQQKIIGYYFYEIFVLNNLVLEFFFT